MTAEELQRIAGLNPDPALIIDPSTLRILFCNALVADRIGCSQEELANSPLIDLVPPDEAQDIAARLTEAADETFDAGIIRLRCKSGTWWPAQIRCRRIDSAPSARILASLHDASRMFRLLHDAEAQREQLREYDTNLRMAQRLLGMGTWSMDIPTGILFWSEHVYSIYGVDPDGFSPDFDAYVALVHPEDRESMIAVFSAFRESDERHFTFRHRILRHDGRIVHVQGMAERDDAGGHSRLNGVVQDISQQVEARERLAEAARIQRIAGRVARLGGWRVDLSPLTLTWTPETADIHQIDGGAPETLEEAIGYYIPQHRDIIRTAFGACARDGRPFDEVLQIRGARGARLWVRAIGEPVRDEAGEVVAVEGAFQDVTELVTARETSEGLSQRLMHTLESISDAFFTLDHSWRFSFLNSQAEQLLKRKREELLGTIVWDEFPGAVGSMFQTEYERAVAEGRTIRFREYYPPLDTWFEVDAYPTPEGLAVYFRDVTQALLRERHLRLLEAAISRQNDILLITEAAPIDAPDGPRIVYVNDAFVRLTGYSREEALGRTPRMLQGPETQREQLDNIRHSLEKQLPVRAELLNYKKNGEKFWLDLDIVPLSSDDGAYTHFVAIERDITERKQVDEAIRVSEERFRLISQATNDIIRDWNIPRDRLWWNDNLFRIFGYTPDSIKSGPEFWISRIHQDDRDRVLARFNAALEGAGDDWTDEYRFLHADGYPLTVVDRGFIIRDGDGRAVRMLGSMIDVTERRDIERRLRQSQRLEAIGQLTGGVAHDFNNLLTVILGNAEILHEELGDRTELRHLAEVTSTAAERGAELTNRLLAFSRQQALEPRLLDVNRLITGMEALLRRTLMEDINLEVIQGAALWLSEIDPGQLETAVLNLVINARDAMPEGGHITIETGNATLDQNYVAIEDELDPGEYVVITVSDTGIGMDHETMSRVFEPFFTTKDVGKGSGLGLSMVYGFLKQSRGHVRVYSEPDVGTSVKLYFPRARSREDAAVAEESKADFVGGNETILVVEDDSLVRENLVIQLRSLGYRVIDAASGPRALEILREVDEIDMMLTDVVMPGGMNGRQLAEAALKDRPALRVMFTSGYSENAIIHHGRLDPGVELLSKPFRRDQLAAKVRNVLDR